MRYGRFSLLGVVLATAFIGGHGCNEEPAINRVGTLVVDKSVFTGSWYMTQTVVDVAYEAAAFGTFPGDSASDFAGSFGGIPRIRWVIDEGFIYAYRDYEMIQGADGAVRDPGFLGQPVAAFKIEKHFDIKRDYNTVTGEQQNVIAENDSDRPWYERDFMRVDWSQNLIPGYYGMTSDLYEVFGIYVREPAPLTVQTQSDFPDSWAPRFDRMPCTGDGDTSAACHPYERDLAGDYAKDELYHMSFVNQEIISPGNVNDPFTGQLENFCTSPYTDAPACTATAVYVRTSFLKVSATRQYEATNWSDTRWDRAGYFRLDTPTWDRSVGSPSDPAYFSTDFLNYAVSRHNIWKTWYTEDAATHVRTPVPPAMRTVRPIVWYTTPELPAHLVRPALDLASQWNEVLMETVRLARGEQLPRFQPVDCQDTDPDAYCACQRDDAGVLLNATCPGIWDPFKSRADNQANVMPGSGDAYDCQVVVPAGAEPDLESAGLSDSNFYGWFGATMQGADCVNVLRINTCNRQSIAANGGTSEANGNHAALDCQNRGDARFKFLSYVDQPGTPFLGIATLRGDPVTGEIRFGDANIGGPALDGYRTSALQVYDLIQGNVYDTEFITGEDVRSYLSTLNSTQLPNPPRIDFNVGIRGVAPSALPAEALALNRRMDTLMWGSDGPGGRELGRLEQLRGDVGRGNIYSDRLQNLVGTDVERRLTANWDTLAAGGISSVPAGYSPANLPEGVLDLVSPFRTSPAQVLAHYDAVEEKLGRMNVHMPNEYVDDSVMQFVQHHMMFSRAHLQFAMNRVLFRQTEVHEMGHCLGLRHDFGGTADTHNYYDQYYAINARYPWPDPTAFDLDGVHGLSAAEQTAYNTAYRTIKRNRELAGIDGWTNSSVMDYTANWYERMEPIGKYDHAAIRMGYGDIVQVNDNTAGLNINHLPSGDHDLTHLINPLNTPRVDVKWYAGGELCNTSDDCPYSTTGARAAELLSGNTSAGVTQHCITDPSDSGARYCSNFDNDMAAVVGTSDNPRWAPVTFRFCSDERAAGLSTQPGTLGWCNRFDEGDSYREIVNNVSESYDRMYIFSNFRRYRRTFGIGGYLFDTLIGRRLVLLQNVYMNLLFQYSSDPAFRTDTNAFGYYDEFYATADILNFYAKVLGSPDVGAYQWNDRWKWYERGNQDCHAPGGQLSLCLGQARYLGSLFQGGITGIYRLERIGTFFDKYYVMYLMTNRGFQRRYTRDLPFYANFYDIFPQEMDQLFNGLIRGDPHEYAAHVNGCTAGTMDCAGGTILYNDFYRGECDAAGIAAGLCRQPTDTVYAGLPIVNGGSYLQLQIYAAEFGLANFPVFFDTSFQNQVQVCVEGEGDCNLPAATAVECTSATGTACNYVRYTSARFTTSYLAFQVAPRPGEPPQPAIGFSMVTEAKNDAFILDILRRDQAGSPPTAPELAAVAALGYSYPTTAALRGTEINRLDNRLQALESFFVQLVQLERLYGIDDYVRF